LTVRTLPVVSGIGGVKINMSLLTQRARCRDLIHQKLSW